MIPNQSQFTPSVENFQTVHPEGKNSTYTKLPDGRWMRDKKATGETHIAGTTRFVHPQYGENRPHPIAGVRDYNPLEMATAHGELIGSSGQINYKTVADNGKSSINAVPEHHISSSPRPGWLPVEHTMKPDGTGVASYHLGHPVADFNKSNFRI